jgi:hypothetical protein
VQHLDFRAFDEAEFDRRLSSSWADSAEPTSPAARCWITPE